MRPVDDGLQSATHLVEQVGKHSFNTVAAYGRFDRFKVADMLVRVVDFAVKLVNALDAGVDPFIDDGSQFLVRLRHVIKTVRQLGDFSLRIEHGRLVETNRYAGCGWHFRARVRLFRVVGYAPKYLEVTPVNVERRAADALNFIGWIFFPNAHVAAVIVEEAGRMGDRLPFIAEKALSFAVERNQIWHKAYVTDWRRHRGHIIGQRRGLCWRKQFNRDRWRVIDGMLSVIFVNQHIERIQNVARVGVVAGIEEKRSFECAAILRVFDLQSVFRHGSALQKRFIHSRPITRIAHA